jgi:cardiolipin synthase
MTLANKITIVRIVCIPIIVILLLTDYRHAAITLLIFSFLTDALDGFVARRRGEQTKLGAFLDPMADKLLLSSLFLTLTFMRGVPIWIFVAVFSRDLLIVLGWSVIYILTRSFKITPRALGKFTTCTQMLAALLVIVKANPHVQHVALWLVVVITALSTIDYIIIGEKLLGEWES